MSDAPTPRHPALGLIALSTPELRQQVASGLADAPTTSTTTTTATDHQHATDHHHDSEPAVELDAVVDVRSAPGDESVTTCAGRTR